MANANYGSRDGRYNLDGIYGPPLFFRIQSYLGEGGEARRYAKDWLRRNPMAIVGPLPPIDALDRMYPDDGRP